MKQWRPSCRSPGLPMQGGGMQGPSWNGWRVNVIKGGVPTVIQLQVNDLDQPERWYPGLPNFATAQKDRVEDRPAILGRSTLGSFTSGRSWEVRRPPEVMAAGSVYKQGLAFGYFSHLLIGQWFSRRHLISFIAGTGDWRRREELFWCRIRGCEGSKTRPSWERGKSWLFLDQLPETHSRCESEWEKA